MWQIVATTASKNSLPTRNIKQIINFKGGSYMRKFYLVFTIITLALIIIATGCGGSGDSITTPSSITNQTETRFIFIS